MPSSSANRPFIPWHRRMEARVALCVSLLVAVSLGAVLLVVTRVVTSRSLSRASEELEVARLTFTRSLDSRAESAAALTRLVTELPVFRAHMTDARLAADTGTVHQMADGYRQQLGAQFCIVTNGRGGWLGSPGWTVGQWPASALDTTIGSAARGRSHRDIVSIQDRLFLVVSEPALFGDEVLGTMTVGYALDDSIARAFSQVTRCQVNLVSGGRLSASSLPESERATLAGRLSASAAPSIGLSTRVQLGTTRYIEGVFPLQATEGRLAGTPGAPQDYGPHRLILLQDWAPIQQFLDALQAQFFWAGMIIFGFAVPIGVVLSRRMSQPLREIASAAGDIAAGNWDRQVPIGRGAEAATMASAFNKMSTSLRGAQERLLHDAFHDQLTQLPNRTLFMERLQRALARRVRHPESTFAVLFVDLDRFKTVNDSLGHPAGDQLLLEIARRITRALRSDDTVSRPIAAPIEHQGENTLARLGGDEFTILLEGVRDPSDAVRIAERIQEALVVPIALNGHDVFASVSIGIAVSTSMHHSGEDVVRDADIAMYRAKASGGNRCAVFDAAMHERAVERLQLETDLRRALERDEFILHYQPIVSLCDQQLIGFEALIRWQHPEQGLLSPAAFLKVAEETGLITRIDHAVLTTACRDALRWQTEFPSASPISVSVNISAQGFGQPNLVALVAKTLEETGLPPHSLRLEITESVAMADGERASAILGDLKALGVRISLDDFGTGYSSLSYLQRFPVDTLKIDRSFIAGMDGRDECREIIRTILNLARTLRLDVIAEGAETAAQVDYLEGLDCRFGQGYFFSKPLPLDELRERFLRESSTPVGVQSVSRSG